jgi:hypothetical protein
MDPASYVPIHRSHWSATHLPVIFAPPCSTSPFTEVADFWAPLLFYLLFLLVFFVVVLMFVGLLFVDDCWGLGALLCC